MSDLYRKADEAGNAVQLNMTPTDNIVQRLEALEAKCVPATDSNQGLVQPDNDTIVILNGKLVATGLHMAWNAQTDYKPGWIVRGPDGKDYVAKEPSGPETNVGPKDPTDITNNQYWEEWSGGGGAKPVIIPAPTILGNLAPIAGQQYTYTFEVAGIALDSVAKFEIALSLNNQGTVTTRTAEVSASNNVATWPFQVPATMRNGDTITMQVVAVDKLGNRSDPAIANLSVGVVNVDAPTITSPNKGAVICYQSPAGLTVKTTQFTIRGATDAHVSTDWVISSDSNGQNVVAQASNSSDLTSHTFTKADLAGMRDGQTYYILARHRSRTYGVSAWSAAVGVMAREFYITKPVVLSPKNGEEIYCHQDGITLDSSEFESLCGHIHHETTIWKICSDRNGNNTVIQTSNSTFETLWKVTAEECQKRLTAGQTYYAFAQFYSMDADGPDNDGLYSEWSDPVAFVALADRPSIKCEIGFDMTNLNYDNNSAIYDLYDVFINGVKSGWNIRNIRSLKAGDILEIRVKDPKSGYVWPYMAKYVKRFLKPLPKISYWDGHTHGLGTSFADFYGLFEGNSYLTEVDEDLFINNPDVTNFQNVFKECPLLLNIPEGIFRKQTNATNFASAFSNCKLQRIPEGLFANNPKAANFNSCFHSSATLTSIPENLFANNQQITDMGYCFAYCRNITSKVPTLWTRTGVNGRYCYYDCTNAANYADIPAGWK